MSNHKFTLRAQDGVNIFAQEWEPDSPVRGVIALVHGLGEHSGRYEHVANWFNQKGFAVLSMDLRGHGQTPGARGHIPGYDSALLDIDLLIDEAAKKYPELPIFLYGHSLGGALVLYHSLNRRAKLRGVIATSPGLVPATPPSGITLWIAKTASKIAPSMLIDNNLDVTGLARDPQVIQRYTTDPLVHGKISARLGLDLIQNGLWIIEHGAEFPLPLLLMVGSADRLVNPDAVRKLAKVIPANRLTFVEWEGYYHELHNEPEKELVFQEMLKWLESLIASP